MGEQQPSLGQLIWLVRRELEWAYGVDADHPLRFEVGTVELDVTVEATRTTAGGGGLDLKVLGVGASGEVSRESGRGTTSQVHVVLTPKDARQGGRKFEVSAMDTEPPPRRAEATQLAQAASEGAGWGARDTEPVPGS